MTASKFKELGAFQGEDIALLQPSERQARLLQEELIEASEPSALTTVE